MDRVVPRRRRTWPYVLGALVVAGLSAAAVGVNRLAAAPPHVPRTGVWFDVVRRTEFVREVAGTGRLVSDNVRVVAARAPGMVDRILVRPGEVTTPETVILEISNPDLELLALESTAALKQARAGLLDLRASLDIMGVQQRTVIERVRVEALEAARRVRANKPLAVRQIVPMLEATEAEGNARELEKRLALEQEHATILEGASEARVQAQRAKIEEFLAQAELRRQQVTALKVVAGAPGILKDLPVQVGQQVKLGDLLAKVVDPSALKAEVRVPEARATGLIVGLRARVSVAGAKVAGRVTRIDPGVTDGEVWVDVTIDEALPAGAGLDASVDAFIELERRKDVLVVGKPPFASAHETVHVYKVLPGGRRARRTAVALGGSSVDEIEILAGAREGEKLVLSDTSDWNEGRELIEFD